MKIEILSVQQFPSTDMKRLGQMDSLIIYRVDKERTNSVTIAKSPVDAKEIEAAITAQQKTVAPLIGHSFEIK